MIYNRNGEGYRDPTAGEAIANILKQERRKKRIDLHKKHKKDPLKKQIPKFTENDGFKLLKRDIDQQNQGGSRI